MGTPRNLFKSTLFANPNWVRRGVAGNRATNLRWRLLLRQCWGHFACLLSNLHSNDGTCNRMQPIEHTRRVQCSECTKFILKYIQKFKRTLWVRLGSLHFLSKSKSLSLEVSISRPDNLIRFIQILTNLISSLQTKGHSFNSVDILDLRINMQPLNVFQLISQRLEHWLVWLQLEPSGFIPPLLCRTASQLIHDQ